MRHEINFGLGVLHLDVLRARLRRRRALIRGCIVLIGLAIGLWFARPLLQGQGTLVLLNRPADATILLDDQLIAATHLTTLTGIYQLNITRSDAYPITHEIYISRNQTTTLELPSLRPRPSVQAIPLPAPGAAWTIASPDVASGWRLSARGVDVLPTPAMNLRGAEPSPIPATILRLNALGLSRVSALEAYPAADEYIDQGRFWSAWEPLRSDAHSAAGRLTISTPTNSTIITTTTPISGLWWAPGAQHLLIAQQRGIGQDLSFWSASHLTSTLTTPIVTIPGQIASVRWSPDGRGVVLLSTRPNSSQPSSTAIPPPNWEATLLLVGAGPEPARAVRLTSPPPAPVGLIPMDWQQDALYWTADTPDGRVLERIPFRTALPERLGQLPNATVALRVYDDNQFRLLVRAETGVVTMRTWPNERVLFTLDDVPSAPAMGGMWSGDMLLLASGDTLWQLTFAAEALQ